MTSASDDIASSLDEGAISASLGRLVAEARARRGTTMRAVAAEAGISQPFLSQIENGRTMPSLLTLYRIAMALGLTPADLMPPDLVDDPIRVVRRGEGNLVRVSEEPNAAVGRILTAAGSVVTEYRVAPDEDLGDWFRSDGELVVYVVAGRVAVTIDGRGRWELDQGEAIVYPGNLRNVWSVDEPATILLVHQPPPINTAVT